MRRHHFRAGAVLVACATLLAGACGSESDREVRLADGIKASSSATSADSTGSESTPQEESPNGGQPPSLILGFKRSDGTLVDSTGSTFEGVTLGATESPSRPDGLPSLVLGPSGDRLAMQVNVVTKAPSDKEPAQWIPETRVYKRGDSEPELVLPNTVAFAWGVDDSTLYVTMAPSTEKFWPQESARQVGIGVPRTDKMGLGIAVLQRATGDWSLGAWIPQVPIEDTPYPVLAGKAGLLVQRMTKGSSDLSFYLLRPEGGRLEPLDVRTGFVVAADSAGTQVAISHLDLSDDSYELSIVDVNLGKQVARVESPDFATHAIGLGLVRGDSVTLISPASDGSGTRASTLVLRDGKAALQNQAPLPSETRVIRAAGSRAVALTRSGSSSEVQVNGEAK